MARVATVLPPRSRAYENIYVWKTKTGAIKALRRIFGRKDRKAMKVCEIRIVKEGA